MYFLSETLMIVVVNLLGLGHVDYPFNHEIFIYEIQNISQIEKVCVYWGKNRLQILKQMLNCIKSVKQK